MPLNIRNETVNQPVNELAARTGMTRTEVVHQAPKNKLRRLEDAVPLRLRLQPLKRRILARPATRLEADKTFYDELSGDL